MARSATTSRHCVTPLTCAGARVLWLARLPRLVMCDTAAQEHAYYYNKAI